MDTIKKYLPIINTVCILAILSASVVGVLNLINSNNNTLTALNGDTVWSISFSSGILGNMEYPKVTDKPTGPIGYPVPMLLALQVIKALPESVFSISFEIVYLILPILCLCLLQRLAGMKKNPYRWIVAFFAFFVAWDYIQFDIRALNLNIILLFLVLLSLDLLRRDKEILAGVVLGISVVVKLYSLFLIPLWLYRKRYKAAITAAVVLVATFILLPGVVLGFSEAFYLTLDWLAAIKTTSTAQASQLMVCYLVSFNRAITALFGANQAGGIGSLPQETWDALNTGLMLFKVLWVGIVLAAVYGVQKIQQNGIHLRQVAILLIAPIPISPLLQPHHMVLILPSAFILCSVVVMPKVAAIIRVLAALTPAVIFVFSQIVQIPEPVRGLLFASLTFLLICSLVFLPLNSPDILHNDEELV